MLRFGIWKSESLRRIEGKAQPRRHIALSLYSSLNNLPNETRLELEEKILFRLATSTRITKRTHRDRFQEFDDMSIRCIQEMAKNRDRISIHDVAVSNGQTAVEFYQKLKRDDAVPAVSYLASDVNTSFVSITENGGSLSVITDPRGNIVQVIFPPFVFNTNERENLFYYPLNRFILFLLLQTRVKTILRGHNSRSSGLRVEKIYLMDPHCASLAKEAKDFEVKDYDILEPMDRPFDVVRAMNVLNPDYLSPSQIFASVMNFLKGLTQGGLLISGSNQGSGTAVDGSIFRREDRRLVEIARSGLGSPVCASILKAEIPPL